MLKYFAENVVTPPDLVICTTAIPSIMYSVFSGGALGTALTTFPMMLANFGQHSTIEGPILVGECT